MPGYVPRHRGRAFIFLLEAAILTNVKYTHQASQTTIAQWKFLTLNEALTVTECAKLGEASQAWYVNENLRLPWDASLDGDKLGTLLGRLQCVTKFSAGSKKVLEPLTHAITLGTCKGFREVTIDDRNGVVPAQALISLVQVTGREGYSGGCDRSACYASAAEA
jgi:hypothetical protein